MESSPADENPVIENCIGQALLCFAYQGASHTVAVEICNNLASKSRKAVELYWSLALGRKFWKFMRIHSGYGESVIDMGAVTTDSDLILPLQIGTKFDANRTGMRIYV